MTVLELIKFLRTCDPALTVVTSDGFDVDTASNTCSRNDVGDIGLRELSQLAVDEGYTEEDVMSDGEPVVVLWP